MEFPVDVLALLFLVSVLASFIDTLAGGGGLITVPALILSGMPPLSALGTNKLQSSMGTATATFMLLKNKRITWATIKYLMLSAFIGSVCGTIAVQFMDTAALEFVIPCVLVIIAVYFLLSPKPSTDTKTPRVSEPGYALGIAPIIGFYDGMFGPGTGSFFAMSGVAFRGQSLVRATALAKSMNFSTNIASLFVFLFVGHIVWAAGLVMMCGQVIGAWCGSHFLFRIKASYLRALVVLMCFSMLAKYLHSMGWFNF